MEKHYILTRVLAYVGHGVGPKRAVTLVTNYGPHFLIENTKVSRSGQSVQGYTASEGQSWVSWPCTPAKSDLSPTKSEGHFKAH